MCTHTQNTFPGKSIVYCLEVVLWTCYGLNVVSSQNLYVEILMPNAGGGAFERYLGHEGRILIMELVLL